MAGRLAQIVPVGGLLSSVSLLAGSMGGTTACLLKCALWLWKWEPFGQIVWRRSRQAFWVHFHQPKQPGGGVNVTLSRWDVPWEVTEMTLHQWKAYSSRAELLKADLRSFHVIWVWPKATGTYVRQLGSKLFWLQDITSKCECLCGRVWDGETVRSPGSARWRNKKRSPRKAVKKKTLTSLTNFYSSFVICVNTK